MRTCSRESIRSTRSPRVAAVSLAASSANLSSSWLSHSSSSEQRPQSASLVLQPLLTLDDLPMDHSGQDCRQRTLSSRQERSSLEERLQSARLESGSLREYGRQRFESLVEQRYSPWQQLPLPPPLPCPHFRLQPTSRPTTTTTAGPRGGREALLLRWQPDPASRTAGCLSAGANNGPSKGGSILYTGVPPLLQTLGAPPADRPSSEPAYGGGRFNHLRGARVSYPLIQRTLRQSNGEYRLVATPCPAAAAVPGRRPPEAPRSPDYLLFVPVSGTEAEALAAAGWGPGEEEEEVEEEDEKELQQESEAEFLMLSSARSSPQSGGHTRTEEARFTSPDGEASLRESSSSGSPTFPIRLSSNLPSTPDPDEESTVMQLPAEEVSKKRKKKPSDIQLGGRRRTRDERVTSAGSGSHRRAPSSKSSSAVSVSSLPRPHCWVDDVTVSSDYTLSEQADTLPQLPQQSDAPAAAPEKAGAAHEDPDRLKGQGQAVGRSPSPGGESKKSREAAQIPRKVSPLQPPGSNVQWIRSVSLHLQGGNEVLVRFPKRDSAVSAGGGQEGHGVDADGGACVEHPVKEASPPLVLPRFVCPSSEIKSRQVATREWLAKTSFSAACRTVPIM